MKLISWNVNGLRASWDKGLANYISEQMADVVCLQEIKIQEHQLEDKHRHPLKYNSFWNPAQKPGYSGVATYSKKDPENVVLGIGNVEADKEGRVLTLEFSDFFMVNAYFPNSQRDHARLPFKLEFCSDMLKFCDSLKKKGKDVVLCGDFNIAHKEIDLKNPKSNQDNAGFLPEERAWMDTFLDAGYVDGFRQFEKAGGHYTWWSYRPGVREKNIGWRLDYHCYNKEFVERAKSAEIHSKVMGSDHCPVQLIMA